MGYLSACARVCLVFAHHTLFYVYFIFYHLPQVEAQGSVSIITKALQMLKAAQSRSAGRLDIKQKELERNASEKVARAKRLAKKGRDKHAYTYRKRNARKDAYKQ